MRALHFHSGGSVIDTLGNVLSPEEARCLALVLTDEFHGALKATTVPAAEVVERARQVDLLNTAIDEQMAWNKPSEGLPSNHLYWGET